VTIELVALTIGTCASLLWLGLMGRKLEGRVNTLEDRVDSATFVPPCAHEWKVLREVVAEGQPMGGEVNAGELVILALVERSQSSTTIILACDKCGERATQTMKGAPSQ